MRTELEPVLKLARGLPPEELPEFLGALETVRVVALARIVAPAVDTRPDELLNVPQAAARLNVSENYLYRNSRRLPFTRRVGSKLLFSSAGLDTYLRGKR